MVGYSIYIGTASTLYCRRARMIITYSKPPTGTTTSGLYVPGTALLSNHNSRPAQLSLATCSPAAQRSAVRGAVPCPALRCCAVLRCVFFRTYSSTRYETKYQVPGIFVMCTCLFVFSSVDLSRSPKFTSHANCTRIVHQNVTSSTSTQRSTAQHSAAQRSTAQHSAGHFTLHKQLLTLSIRCSHQIMSLFLLPPLNVLVVFFLA